MKIVNLIRDSKHPFFSLEFFPPKEKEKWDNFFYTVEKLKTINPLFTSVTYGGGGSTQDYTLELTSRLKLLNFNPMAHLTCIGANVEHLRVYIQSLLDVGVGDVLALRGDIPLGQTIDWNMAQFRYAIDLVKFIKNEYPQMGICVAGYPAPHPESDSFALDRLYTLQKIQAGADYIITQLFFDVREYFDLVAYIRANGYDTPIIPGVFPIQSFDSIKRILGMCGTNIPGKLYLQLEDANQKGGVEAVREIGLSFAVEQIQKLLAGGAPGIHLYTLNRSGLCLKIVENVGL